MKGKTKTMKARYLKVKVAGKDEGILGDMNSIFEDSNYLLHYKDIHQVLNTTNQRHTISKNKKICVEIVCQNPGILLGFSAFWVSAPQKKTSLYVLRGHVSIYLYI